MNNKLQLIEPPDYILAVSDEEIKEGDWFLVTSGIGYKILSTQKAEYDNDGTKSWSDSHCKKIIAHTPKGNTPELDLPLLPEMVDNNDVDKITKVVMNKWVGTLSKMKISPEEIDEITEEHSFYYLQGYKAATKVYDEEDLRGAFISGKHGGKTETYMEFEEFIQSLKQSKTPKWFVAEVEYYYHSSKEFYSDAGFVKCSKGQYESIKSEIPTCPLKTELKTSTINNKTYLVGHYEY
jgi:hypothetical protein